MIVAFAGKKRAGKTTAANMTDLPVMSFATPLKELCDALLSEKGNLYHEVSKWCCRHDLHPDLEKRIQAVVPDLYYGNFLVEDDTKPRRLYQYIGTDICRAYDPEIWVKLLRKKLTADIAIDDLRFPNESKVADFTIYILGGESGDNHPSENSVQPEHCNEVIMNDGTKEQLKEKVKCLLS